MQSGAGTGAPWTARGLLVFLVGRGRVSWRRYRRPPPLGRSPGYNWPQNTSQRFSRTLRGRRAKDCSNEQPRRARARHCSNEQPQGMPLLQRAAASPHPARLCYLFWCLRRKKTRGGGAEVGIIRARHGGISWTHSSSTHLATVHQRNKSFTTTVSTTTIGSMLDHGIALNSASAYSPPFYLGGLGVTR